MLYSFYWPHRLTVRTAGSQSANRSSILREVTATKNTNCLVFFAFRREDGGLIFSRKIAESGAGKFSYGGRKIIVAHIDFLT